MVFAAVLAPATDLEQPLLGQHLKDLVVLQEDQFVPVKSSQLHKAQYLVLYFGAGWCPDCRRFSPALVAAYDHQDPQNGQFEVLFITRDKSEQDMLKFMRLEKMKWPALAFDKVAAASDLTHYYSGHGIPCLSVLDQKGTVVLQSKSDQDGGEVLEQLKRMLKRSN